MGLTSRRKGKVGERQSCEGLRKIGVLGASRRVRNREGEDDLVGALLGVSFECKLENYVRIAKAMRQAIEQAGGDIPVVLHRETVTSGAANPLCITLRLADLPKLLDLYHQQRTWPVPAEEPAVRVADG